MKDYYKIMNVPYDASAEDIRNAYHRFAKKYHPDRNDGQAAKAIFLDIQEAYQTLSDEQRRRLFHAKTHYPLPAAKRAMPAITSETILQQCQMLNNKIRGTNKYQINLAIISRTIDSILSENNLKVLLAEKKSQQLAEVVDQLIKAMKVLPYRLIVSSTSRLLRLTANNPLLQEQVIAFGNRKRKLRFWEKYNLVIILAATLLLCVLIVFLSE